MNPAPLALSRTSSTTSIESSGDETVSISTTNTSASRRTRKRFTNVQLTMLENLFHQNSHPSREDREGVAKAGGMEVKSVTIWFQNKRQTERKTAASSGHLAITNAPDGSRPERRNSSPTFPSSRSNSSSSSSRPTLDRVASRTELRNHAPRTPLRRHNPDAALWDIMPSSPLGPPVSPPAREFVEFGKSRRTLEWACAAARLAEKDGQGTTVRDGSGVGGTMSALPLGRGRIRDRERERGRQDAMDLDLTDEEEDQLVTPPSTWGKADTPWGSDRGGVGMASMAGLLPKGVEDDDMLKAALALCGLGRRSV